MNILEIYPSLGQARGTEEYPSTAWADAQYLDWGGELNHIASAVFNRSTGLVYCLELFTGAEALRYLDPTFEADALAELRAQGIDTEDSGQGAWIPINEQIALQILSTLNPYDPT